MKYHMVIIALNQSSQKQYVRKDTTSLVSVDNRILYEWSNIVIGEGDVVAGTQEMDIRTFF